MKKMTKNSRAVALVIASLAAFAAFADVKDERLTRAYQNAMADYTSGRLDAALDGFAKAVREDGDNASARFQLACLEQDHKRDFIAAICDYREYLRIAPSSDKAPLAKERMALCERELAKLLASKYSLGANIEDTKEGERIKNELAAATKKATQAEKDLDDLKHRLATLERENERLRRQVRSVGGEDSSAEHKRNSAIVLLEEDESAAAPKIDVSSANVDDQSAASPRKMSVDAAARALAEERDDGYRPQINAPKLDEEPVLSDMRGGLAAAKALALEEDDVSSPTILDNTARTPSAEKLSEMGNPFRDSAKDGDSAPSQRTYVVEEGDTLYKIARKFYGKDSMWKKIRDANKATITTDGRVMAGQTIILP